LYSPALFADFVRRRVCLFRQALKKTLIDSWEAQRFDAHKLREGKRPRFIQQPASNNQ